MLPSYAYAGVLLIPILTMVGIVQGGAWTWAVVGVLYGVLPAIELVVDGTTANPSPEQETDRRADWRFAIIPLLLIPLQFAAIIVLASRAHSLGPVSLLGAIISVGSCCGIIGLNVGHELGHRRQKHWQMLSRVLYGTSLYAHFFVEHNRGHHARVATPDDPASARRGEVVYPFWFRSITGGLASAWALEAKRLQRKGGSAWSPRNEVLVGFGLQGAAVLSLGLVFGWVGAAAFCAAALVGVLLLETINYIEHYGLTREQRDDGRYVKVQPHHSWNSERPLSRVLLFDLSRHSDHHAFPTRPHPVLRHHDHAPELPTGYAGMVLLAFVPPLFHAVMHRQLDREERRLRTREMAA